MLGVGSVLSLEYAKGKARGPLLIRFFFAQQDSADQSSSEDLCYTLINHSVLGGKSSGISAERCYENISPKTETPSESLGKTEVSYALLRVPSSPRHSSSPEDAYELIIPRRVFSYSLQQPHPPTPHLENRVSY